MLLEFLHVLEWNNTIESPHKHDAANKSTLCANLRTDGGRDGLEGLGGDALIHSDGNVCDFEERKRGSPKTLMLKLMLMLTERLCLTVRLPQSVTGSTCDSFRNMNEGFD